MSNYITKDSGKRHEESNGYVRDTQEDKPRFNLILLKDVPYTEQPLTLFAELLARGAEKYNDRNWENACNEPALERAKESLMRHCIQACCNEDDEDHLSAVCFNAFLIRNIKRKLQK
jgi:hypothetical protein